MSLKQVKVSTDLGVRQFYFTAEGTIPGLTPTKLCSSTQVSEDYDVPLFASEILLEKQNGRDEKVKASCPFLCRAVSSCPGLETKIQESKV